MMKTIKKRTTSLLLALFLTVSLFGCTMNPPAGIGAGEPSNNAVSETLDDLTLGDDEGTVQQDVSTEQTPGPEPEPTVKPTLESTPEPTPEPTPMPTPIPVPAAPPVITKQPTDEYVSVGGTAYFVAKADGVEEISWYIAGPDGTTGYSAKEISIYLPAVSCSGYDTDTLTVSNVTADMDGWKAVCRFTNSAGKTYSTAAVIHVGLPASTLSKYNTSSIIEISKHPGNSTVYVGERVAFLAAAKNARGASEWKLISADGKREIVCDSDEFKALFPGVSCTIWNGDIVIFENISIALNGWYVFIVYSDINGGTMASNAALITVLNGTAPVYAPLTVADVTGTSLDATTIQKLLDFLDSLCHMQMPGHAGTGLSGAAASSSLADFFMESGIAAKDVELIAKLYYQRLSADDRFQYVVNSNFINSLYVGNFNPENIEFYKKSLIDTCGYVPVYYPWDQRDLTDCFAALVVD